MMIFKKMQFRLNADVRRFDVTSLPGDAQIMAFEIDFDVVDRYRDVKKLLVSMWVLGDPEKLKGDIVYPARHFHLAIDGTEVTSETSHPRLIGASLSGDKTFLFEI